MARAKRPPLTITAWLRWDVVSRLLPPDADRVLDIGAGAGSMGSLLAGRYDYLGIEPDPISYAKARQRVGDRGEVLNCRFEDLEPKQDFDLVCAFEVLEHIEDDAAAVSSWVRHLRPGGSLLVSVPRGPGRFGPGDEKAGHFRRYEPEHLVSLFETAGLRDTVTAIYGTPWGNFQETIRNVVFRVRPGRQTVDERTAASGRFLQPPAWAAEIVRGVAFPLQRLQRPFASRGIGTGLVGRGRLEMR